MLLTFIGSEALFFRAETDAVYVRGAQIIIPSGADSIAQTIDTDDIAALKQFSILLFTIGLGALGLFGWRRRRKASVSLLGAA